MNRTEACARRTVRNSHRIGRIPPTTSTSSLLRGDGSSCGFEHAAQIRDFVMTGPISDVTDPNKETRAHKLPQYAATDNRGSQKTKPAL